MASLALSVVGTAIGGPLGGALGGIVGGLIDNLLFPSPKPSLPPITASTYGNAIPAVWGPLNRLGVNMIWTSGFHHHTSKDDSKLIFGAAGLLLSQQTTVVVDLALAVAAGPLDPSWLKKIWANGTVIFDASRAGTPPVPDGNGVVVWTLSHGSHEAFFDVTVYPGNNLQPPNSTIEGKEGVGNVPAYHGTAYIVINGLQTAPYGNGVPVFGVEVKAQAEITLAAVCADIIEDCGLDLNRCSTSALTYFVEGYSVTSPTDGLAALQPLGLVYNFDVAEVSGGLRLAPRGLAPICTIEVDQLGGYAFGDQAPDAFAWPREPESTLPRVASITFNDPARDLNQNTASAKRESGTATSNISTTVSITMTPDQARSVASRLLWEPQVARQTFHSTADDRLIFIESGRTYAIDAPFGYDSVRITKRARGANGVLEFEGKRDYSRVYLSTAPGASAGSLPNQLQIGGPVNPPVFIEPNKKVPFFTQPALLIGISGGDGTTFSPDWNGCDIYVATSDTTGDYIQIGSVFAPALMGKLTTPCASFGGSNPDTTPDLFTATFLECNGEVPTLNHDDAADALFPYHVGQSGTGEFLSIENPTDHGGNVFSMTNVWRGLYETSANAHIIGDPIVRLDSRLFNYPLPANYIGRTLYFRFVSPGETLASVTTYTHTPTGSGYGTGAGGTPGTMAAPGLQLAPNTTAVVVSWVNPGPADNATAIVISRANGLGQPFGSASPVGTIAAPGTSFVDATVMYGDDYTYFTQSQNEIGLSAASPGADISV